MRNSLVLTFALLLISNFTGIRGMSISQEKCDFYQNMFQQPASNDFPFLVRVYSGYYLNGDLVIENKIDFLNGAIISEDFVLTIANNGAESLLFVEILTMQLEVIQKITNEQQNIMLLKLSEPIEFNNEIRPACLPQQPLPIILSQIICWVDSSWLNRTQVKLASKGTCKQKSVDYIKRIRIQGIFNGTNFCTNVVGGDRDRCNVPGSILLNNHQIVMGIASETSLANLQTYVGLFEHVSWIEDIVWTSTSTIRTTTEETMEPTVTDEITDESSTTTVYVLPASTTANTSSSNETSQVARELHDIHLYLNINMVLIVAILFLLLCVSIILWSDGLCIRAVFPSRFSTSTDV